jgi:hypothetical protein
VTRPVRNPPPRLRQRQRAAGGWRLWWEPEAALRELGFEPVELDARRLTWSVREAERLNAEADAARGGPQRPLDRRAARARSVHALIREYRSSPYWAALRPATQRDYAGGFRLIERKWGSSLVADFSKPIVVEWYETLYRTSGRYQAAALIRKLSVLMSYAELRGWRADNPCLRIRIMTPPSRTRVADWAELDALFAACDGLPSMGLAIALAVFQGQRQKDLVEARRGDLALTVALERDDEGRVLRAGETPLGAIRGGGELARFEDGLGREVLGATWRFLRSKRGNHGGLQLHPEVLPWLARAFARAPEAEALLVYEGTAEAYSSDLFRKVWARVRASAVKAQPHLATLQFRDLRRTFGHLARAGGASERDVGDALGNNAWKDPKISGTYMPATADTAARAVAAIKRPKG